MKRQGGGGGAIIWQTTALRCRSARAAWRRHIRRGTGGKSCGDAHNRKAAACLGLFAAINQACVVRVQRDRLITRSCGAYVIGGICLISAVRRKQMLMAQSPQNISRAASYAKACFPPRGLFCRLTMRAAITMLPLALPRAPQHASRILHLAVTPRGDTRLRTPRRDTARTRRACSMTGKKYHGACAPACNRS